MRRVDRCCALPSDYASFSNRRGAGVLKLYGVLRSRASRNYWLLGEYGQAFEHVPIMQAYRLPNPDAADAPVHTRSPSFLAVNPNGQIPSLVDGDLVLHESLGINLYLARKLGGSLGPASTAEEGQMIQWSLWAATSAEPHTIQVLYHRVGKPPAERDPAIANAAVEALRAPFAVLDSALAKTGFIVGSRFTAADINVAEVIRYAMPAPELFEGAPRVMAWLAACHARPAYKAMMAKRELEPV
jgi:glutathione S-transferase